ncbi:hypothetical protein GYMLUDRAFT_266191 [Collybiopsis luxurians FD-317 M1]|uniref:Uncharacterized protein n=1 Tax=Collybiopsis luxurians FD-317 M1 TaxID=944289 RepID=A0A0D0B857_9AGAR|nr:hypothetical protein GYMLUDRAFT_266191 [Collybiopsis luxurians FD-317 M1]
MLGSTTVTIAATCSPNVEEGRSLLFDRLHYSTQLRLHRRAMRVRIRFLSTRFFSVTLFSILTTTVITRVFKSSVSSIVSHRIGFIVFTWYHGAVQSSSRYLAIAMEQHRTERFGGLKRHQLYDALLPSLPDDHRMCIGQSYPVSKLTVLKALSPASVVTLVIGFIVICQMPETNSENLTKLDCWSTILLRASR